MIRLATVGTSGICESFLNGAAITNEYKLTAVYSRTFEKGRAFAQKFGCNRVFTNLEEMAKSDLIDAVYIASPNVFHAPQSQLFLKNGKHVLCEKPIVTNVADYTELKALAEAQGLIYMEAIIPRHLSAYSFVHNALKEIGKIAFAEIKYNQRSSRFDAFLKGDKVNIFDMSLHAGALMDLGVYCVYGAVDLLGAPSGISARVSLLPNGADGSGEICFNYGGFNAVLTYSKVDNAPSVSKIVGENGVLEIEMISQYAGAYLIKNGVKTLVAGHLSKAEQMSYEATRFADYILRFEENKEDYLNAVSLCINVHKCMDKIKASAGLVYPEIC